MNKCMLVGNDNVIYVMFLQDQVRSAIEMGHTIRELLSKSSEMDRIGFPVVGIPLSGTHTLGNVSHVQRTPS